MPDIQYVDRHSWKLTEECVSMANKKEAIRLTREELVLICPSCEGENLHQHSATTYWRAEDGDALKTLSSVAGSVTRIQESSKVTGRRDSLDIEFHCEHCPSMPTLRIHQHKGQTFLTWIGAIHGP